MALLLGVGLYQLVSGDLAADHARRPRAQLRARASASDGVLLRRRRSSSCCTPSPRAAPPSPASRPSPTACPPSRSRRGRTPARRSWSWASSLGVMFLGLSLLAVEDAPGAVRGGHADGHLPDRRGGLRRDEPSATCSSTRSRPARCSSSSWPPTPSFADFPRLASFQAGDNFMPRQLTKRGHRLVFSNGIIALAVAAIVLLIVTGAKVDRLIPLYAIGVFTQLHAVAGGHGQAPPHARRSRAGGWASSSTASAPSCRSSSRDHRRHQVHPRRLGDHRAHPDRWSSSLFRLNKQYESEEAELEQRRRRARPRRRSSRRHVVIVLVDHLDMAAARAIQYARTLTPDELRGGALRPRPDPHRGPRPTRGRRLGLRRASPLDVVECPDRRIDAGRRRGGRPASWSTATPR